MYRGWTQTDYQNKHYNINQKDEGTQDDRGREGGTNFILRIKEQETRLTLQEHDDDDEFFDVFYVFRNQGFIFRKTVVYVGMVQRVLHAEITIKGIYKISKYNIFELLKYIDTK